jgi:hypothetical protein
MTHPVRWRERASAYLLAQLLRASDKAGMLAIAKEIESQLSRIRMKLAKVAVRDIDCCSSVR